MGPNSAVSAAATDVKWREKRRVSILVLLVVELETLVRVLMSQCMVTEEDCSLSLVLLGYIIKIIHKSLLNQKQYLLQFNVKMQNKCLGNISHVFY